MWLDTFLDKIEIATHDFEDQWLKDHAADPDVFPIKGLSHDEWLAEFFSFLEVDE